MDWALAGLFILIPALVLRASLRRPEELGTVDKAVLRVSAPLQSGVSWIFDRLGSLWDRYVALVGTEQENEELRAENEKVRGELAAAERKAFDVEDLEDAAQLRRQTPADTIGARVIATSLTSAYRVVRLQLDRGKEEVSVGMPVITSKGLVGRIQAAYGRHSNVLLLTDPQSSVEVVVKRTGQQGNVKGATDRYGCTIEVERPSDPGAEPAVKVGDELYTSGVGAAFPAGIKVGTVTKVKALDYQMFDDVDVEPAVDFSRLRVVEVLLAPPPPPDPEAKTPKRSEPAKGVHPY
ncbi:MAG TPA: rod shape-determining protein MreC [Kofleriaceae bacterium]|nr:rod shape-determining protein MreC [Kofleriaceae bacterium]